MRIGTKLTLWGTIITLSLCSAVCLALYIGLNVSLHNEIDRFLEGEVQEFLAILHEEGDDSLSDIEADIRQEVGSRVRNDLTFRLLDRHGKLIVTSNADDPFPNPWPVAAIENTRPDADAFETMTLATDGSTIRACSRQTVLPTRGTCFVQATYTLSGLSASLSRFRHLCWAVMAITLVLSIIGGRILARKSLRPVYFMARTARRIGAENLSKRISRTNNGDELDNLAAVLNDMLNRLELQFQRIQQFTADAAHELRTPLAVLRGNAELALGPNASPEDRRRVLEESIQEYDRLAKLANDLLLLAQADSGNALVRREPISLHKVVQDVVDLYSPLVQERRIIFECLNGQPIEIFADGGRIRQVLSNLLDNALKHTPAGGQITVSISMLDGNAHLAVSDTGEGISAEHLPRIFDRFYRADAARTRGSGVGLGLAICRTIAKAHGGDISVTSTKEVGTTVSVRLPTGDST